MTKAEIQQVKLRFGIIGNNEALLRGIDIAIQVAPTDLSVLITGESGVGKESFPQIEQWIVEAETQKEAKTEEEKDKIQKRLRFYEKLGFQKQENIDYTLYGVSYYLYTKAKENVQPEELAKTMRELYGNHIAEDKMLIKIDK